MQIDLVYVAHSKGEFTPEGQSSALQYDKVELSDGMRSFKVKNKTGLGSLDQKFKQGDQVLCKFGIEVGSKQNALLVLEEISPLE